MVSRAPPVLFYGRSLREATTARFRLAERTYTPQLQIPSHAHAEAFLGITLEGRYTQQYGHKTQAFQLWTVSFSPSGEVHSSSYSATGARALYVEIAPEALQWIREFHPIEGGPVGFDGGKPAWFAAHLYHEFCHSDELSPLVLEGLVLQLLAEILRPREVSNARPEWLCRAHEVIRARFAEPLTLVKIAGTVSVHPVHLAHEYRRHYGCTVGEQIRQLRMERACWQMAETNGSLVEIALACGFSDQSHFTVSFRNLTGMTPYEYRKIVRGRLISRKAIKPIQDSFA